MVMDVDVDVDVLAKTKVIITNISTAAFILQRKEK